MGLVMISPGIVVFTLANVMAGDPAFFFLCTELRSEMPVLENCPLEELSKMKGFGPV